MGGLASVVHSAVASHKDAAVYADPTSKHYDKGCLPPPDEQSLAGATFEFFLLISERGVGGVGLARLVEEKFKPDDEVAARRAAKGHAFGYILFRYWSKPGMGLLQELQKGGTGGTDVNARIRQAAQQKYSQIWDDLAKNRERHAQNVDDFLGHRAANCGNVYYPRPRGGLVESTTMDTVWRIMPFAEQAIRVLPVWQLRAAYNVAKYGAIAGKLLTEFAPTFGPLATCIAPLLDRNMSIAQKRGLFGGMYFGESIAELGKCRVVPPSPLATGR